MSILVTIWTLVIVVLMWTPLPPSSPSPIGELDLLVHFGLFLLEGQLLKLWFEPDANRYYWVDWGVTVVALAMCVETVQWFVPGRSVALLDYVANLLALTAGGLLNTRGTSRGRMGTDFATGFLALCVGFGGIFYGEQVFRMAQAGLLRIPPEYLRSAGVLLLVATLIRVVATEGKDQNTALPYYVLLIPGLCHVAFVNSDWNLSLLSVALVTFLSTDTDNGWMRVFRRWGIIIYLVVFAGAVSDLQTFLDHFGRLSVGLSLAWLSMERLYSEWFAWPESALRCFRSSSTASGQS